MISSGGAKCVYKTSQGGSRHGLLTFSGVEDVRMCLVHRLAEEHVCRRDRGIAPRAVDRPGEHARSWPCAGHLCRERACCAPQSSLSLSALLLRSRPERSRHEAGGLLEAGGVGLPQLHGVSKRVATGEKQSIDPVRGVAIACSSASRGVLARVQLRCRHFQFLVISCSANVSVG